MVLKVQILNPGYELHQIRSHISEKCTSRELELLQVLTKLLHGDMTVQEAEFSLLRDSDFTDNRLTEVEKERLRSLENHMASDGPVKNLHYYVLSLHDDEDSAIDSREELRSQMLSLDLTIKGTEEEILENFYRSYA